MDLHEHKIDWLLSNWIYMNPNSMHGLRHSSFGYSAVQRIGRTKSTLKQIYVELSSKMLISNEH
jgi:hypothetical protein